MTVSGRVTRRLEDGGGCDGYTDSASVSTQADLQSAIDGSISICIEITADIDIDGQITIPGGNDVRLWASDGAVLNGQGSTRILKVESGAVVKLEGLTFYNGYVSTPPRSAAPPRPRSRSLGLCVTCCRACRV